VVCVETRHMQSVLKAQINKTDRNDARGIAQMMRAGLSAKLDCASLWKSCFAKAIDIHFSPPLTTTSYIFGYSKMGLHLKEHGRRLPGFCISP
jgi:hypothetical protein